MRYAIFSDVHANEAALKAVLADAQDAGATSIFCLGDVLGYGPDPVASLELVHDRVHACLMGNHDAAACGMFPIEEFTEIAANAIEKHRSLLSPKAIDWLKTLPLICEGPGFACAHGDFSIPGEFKYIIEPEDAMPSWLARVEQLLFVGHSHRPGIYVLGSSGRPYCLEPTDFILEDGKRYIVNVGSVGYPRSGECRSYYCIYDDVEKSVSFRSLPFDIDGYRQKMNGQGFDEASWLAVRAAERQHGKVRTAAHFGKAEIIRDDDANGSVVRPQPTNVGNAVAASPRPADGGNGLGTALVLGALLLAFVGVFCTMHLIRAMPDREEKKRIEAIKVKSLVAPQPTSAPTFALDEPIMLSGGWRAYVEDHSRQKVKVERNSKANRAAFRIENAVEATVRFTRTISLIGKPPKVRTDIELLTQPRPGEKSDFGFVAKMEFFKADGKPCGMPMQWSGKVSARNKEINVPGDATSAAFTVECRSEGTHEIAIPNFSEIQSTPERRNDAANAPKGKAVKHVPRARTVKVRRGRKR